MIALDTSALLHVALAEHGYERSVATLLSFEARRVSVVSVVEAQAVLAGRSDDPRLRLDRLLELLRVDAVGVDAQQADVARDAYLRYGRGSGHPARLNLGDVFAYALARAHGLPLAYVGEDLGVTDVRSLRLA